MRCSAPHSCTARWGWWGLLPADHGGPAVAKELHRTACLTANIAAARGVRLTEVRSTVEGDIDLNGVLGLDPAVRNGYEQVAVPFTIRGDAPAATLSEIVEQSRARSAVYVTVWTEVESIRAFAGDRWQEAVVAPGEEQLLRDTWIGHYELFPTPH